MAESSYHHPDREVSSFSPDQLGNSQGRTLIGPAGVTCPPPECDQDGNDWLNHAIASLLALSSKVGGGVYLCKNCYQPGSHPQIYPQQILSSKNVHAHIDAIFHPKFQGVDRPFN